MASNAVLQVIKNAAILDFGLQWLGYAVSIAIKSEKFYDVTGSGTVLLLAYKTFQWGRAWQQRQYIQTACAMIWAGRLGLFLFSRILRDGHDKRFNRIRDDPKMFFVAWTMQGAWVLCNLLPTIIHNCKSQDSPIGFREYAGWGTWLAGFVIQALADHQKNVFRSDPRNADKFIQTGLWALSRHPNYFGEILMWTGLYVSASKQLQGWEHLSVISPLFSAFLLTKVSGIPMLEKAGMKRWGDKPEYMRYLAETPVLIPSLKKLFS